MRIYLLIISIILICSHKALCEVNIIISEVSLKATPGWAELYCLDDRGKGVDISSYKLTDLDAKDTRLSDSKVTLRKGKFAVIHWVESEGTPPYVDETDEIGDINGNGYIDLYTTDRKPSSTDDQLVLVDEKGEYLDAVCWANQNGAFSQGEDKDISTLVKANQWIISDVVAFESDCIDSRKVTSRTSIARIDLSKDSNSKSDWVISISPTKGMVNEIDNILGTFELFINEVSFKEKGLYWVELYCKDDGMEGRGIDISGYYISNGEEMIKTILPGTWIKTSEYLVLHGDISLTSTDEQIILYDSFKNIIDCVCWADQSGTFSKREMKDVQMLIDEGKWFDFEPVGATESDCIESNLVKSGYSIARHSYDIPNSKGNWFIDETPTPGRNNMENPMKPVISNLKVSPSPFLIDGSSQDKAMTKISFDLSDYCSVSIKIYDVKGRLIKDLFSEEKLFGKDHEVFWDGKDNNSEIVPIGIYIVYIKAKNPLGSTIKTATCVATKRID